VKNNLSSDEIHLVASGDLRPSANVACWKAQAAMEKQLAAAVARCGRRLVRAHPYKPDQRHGFIASQKEGLKVFSELAADVPVIVAEAVWQYSHHVLGGLITHHAPILTVANWSGQWPGLVGMLNLNGCLSKAGVKYATLWSEDFRDDWFQTRLNRWLDTGKLTHPTGHVSRLASCTIPNRAEKIGGNIARSFRYHKAILGVFDEGCMGMYNAILPDELLFACGVYKERLSQSALYYETTQVTDTEACEVLGWLKSRGMKFHFGHRPDSELYEPHVIEQCKMYIAAGRIADEFGCDAIGIQYQQGLKDLLPASDLAEGLLNNADRPPILDRRGRGIRLGEPIPHFNEADECAGLDALFTHRVHRALGQPVETTLHDIRWGAWHQDEWVWVFLISGAAPPAHHIDGYAGTDSLRQPAMYFPRGGGTVRGIARPGEIVWSRIFVERGRLNMDIGRAKVVTLSSAATEARWQATTPQWPIMHAVTYGVTRDQMMARHKANHIQVAYARSAQEADLAAYTKAALAAELGIEVSFCGTKADGSPF
jgi:hypothetical protein